MLQYHSSIAYRCQNLADCRSVVNNATFAWLYHETIRLNYGPQILLYAAGVSDFHITRTVGSNIEQWEFEDLKAMVGLTIGWRFNDRWSADTAVERTMLTNLDLKGSLSAESISEKSQVSALKKQRLPLPHDSLSPAHAANV